MSAQTRGFPTGEMRASDADRDLAIAELSEHFQTGRLTQEEFDDRSARALQATTGRQLSELFTDLPGVDGPDPAGPRGTPDPAAAGVPWPGSSAWPGPARLDRSATCRRPVAVVIIGVVAVIAIASLIGNVAHVGLGHGGFGWLIPLLVVGLVLRRIARRR
jgi:Domain of unknown function (DUF1707)